LTPTHTTKPFYLARRWGGGICRCRGANSSFNAYQEGKQGTLNYPLRDQNLCIAQLPFVKARILARHLRADLPDFREP